LLPCGTESPSATTDQVCGGPALLAAGGVVEPEPDGAVEHPAATTATRARTTAPPVR